MGDGAGQVGPLPHWFREGYIRDDDVEHLAQQQREHLPWLYTMVKPVIGLSVLAEIHQADLASGGTHPRTLRGVVNAVGPMPSLMELSCSPSLAWELVSDPQFGIRDPELKTDIILRKFGTLHGHQINVVGWFADEPEKMMMVVFEFDDNLFYPWKVIGLRYLNEQEIGELNLTSLLQQHRVAAG